MSWFWRYWFDYTRLIASDRRRWTRLKFVENNDIIIERSTPISAYYITFIFAIYTSGSDVIARLSVLHLFVVKLVLIRLLF